MESLAQPNSVPFQPEMPVMTRKKPLKRIALKIPTGLERHRSSQPQNVNNQAIMQNQIKAAAQIPVVEEKNLKKFMLHRRIGRQKRILLDRVFEEEDENTLFRYPEDFYSTRMEEEALIAPEVSQRLPTSKEIFDEENYSNHF